jgi:low temperature requirement protein LtrA
MLLLIEWATCGSGAGHDNRRMTYTLSCFGLHRMTARGAESHRVASPLELLFDLVFVVAVSQASVNLHHLISDGHAGEGVLAYLMVFFAVWWAWVNFTWFASAFDTDDWLYRTMTIIQMGGVLVLAAGVHDAMVSSDYTIVTWGYVVMRLALVGQWVRAAVSDPASRPTAVTFAVGVTAVQILWVARLALDPAWQFWSFFVLMGLELLVPVIGESRGRTSWHPHHISERYGLFTLLLLGESLLASATAIFDALGEGEHVAELLGLAASGLVITAGMWWIYFARESADGLGDFRSGFQFGYLHYVVFAAAGAVSAGVEVELDEIVGHTEISPTVAGLSLTLPVALFIASAWVLLLRPHLRAWASSAMILGAVLVALAGLLPHFEYVLTALVVVALVVVLEVEAQRADARSGQFEATVASSS